MVKRGIGAVVLAIIAALLLGYLLKDKSRERQEVVEMKLPGAPEMNIPSLTGTAKVEDSRATLVDETKEKVDVAGSSVVAAASGTASAIKDSANSAASTTKDAVTDAIDNAKPGFAIRPPSSNEQRTVVDNVNDTGTDPQSTDTSASTEAPTTTVVASTTETTKKEVESFKPSIVEEKKKPVKKVAPPKKKETVVTTTKPDVRPAPTVTSGPSGKYSIQLLATSSQSRANKLSKTMKGEGYNSFITQTSNNNKILYRVRVGAHGDRNAAIKAQENMKRRYRKNFFVQNSLVVSN